MILGADGNDDLEKLEALIEREVGRSALVTTQEFHI